MEMTDDQIIQAYWRRDEQAIRESDRKYGAYCFAVAHNILQNREDAAECQNDTWLRAWQVIPPKRPERLKFFFAKITRNLSLSRYRAQTAEKRGGGETELILEELSQCLADSRTAESQYLAKELGGLVNRFVRTLPKRECNVFVRRYFYSEPVKDIAKRYGLTAHHVTVMLSRTRGKLKEHLSKEEFL